MKRFVCYVCKAKLMLEDGRPARWTCPACDKVLALIAPVHCDAEREIRDRPFREGKLPTLTQRAEQNLPLFD
jgi:hypothetical protein